MTAQADQLAALITITQVNSNNLTVNTAITLVCPAV